jgi:hypothetical protein
MSLLARVVHPPGTEVILARDAHPAEKYLSVDANGFLQNSPETSGFDLAEGVFKVASYVWDIDTLTWVRATQSSGGGGGSTAVATKGKRFDQASSTVLYIGEADPGTDTASPAWKIKRVTFDASGFPLHVQYASVGAGACIWDNRGALTYT